MKWFITNNGLDVHLQKVSSEMFSKGRIIWILSTLDISSLVRTNV